MTLISTIYANIQNPLHNFVATCPHIIYNQISSKSDLTWQRRNTVRQMATTSEDGRVSQTAVYINRQNIKTIYCHTVAFNNIIHWLVHRIISSINSWLITTHNMISMATASIYTSAALSSLPTTRHITLLEGQWYCGKPSLVTKVHWYHHWYHWYTNFHGWVVTSGVKYQNKATEQVAT